MSAPTFSKQQNQQLIDKHLGLGEYVPNPAAPFEEKKLKTFISLSESKRLKAISKSPKICIQAGHVNIGFNSITALRGGTGAPGEAAFTQQIRDLVSDALRKRGFTVQGTDANANDDKNITGQDWDYFLAIHYDADVYGVGGGGMFAPDASVDKVNSTSVAVKNAIIGQYFPTTGVKDHQERENGNTQYYYMWQYLSANTPCGLIECGVGQHHPDDYDLLQSNKGKVVEGIVRGLCTYFGIAYDQNPTPTPMPAPVVTNDTVIPQIGNKKVSEVVSLIQGLNSTNTTLQGKIDKAKQDLG